MKMNKEVEELEQEIENLIEKKTRSSGHTSLAVGGLMGIASTLIAGAVIYFCAAKPMKIDINVSDFNGDGREDISVETPYGKELYLRQEDGSYKKW
jgi:hypothetical protein